MNVMILSGCFGMGHISSAIAIQQEIEKQYPESNIYIVDILEYMFPVLNRAIYKSFNMMVGKCHKIYNFFYRSSKQKNQAKMIGKNIFLKKVDTLIKMYNPDLIVSTLPLCSRIIAEYKNETGYETPLATCITDISTHKEWITTHTDAYFVPTLKIKESLIQNGVSQNTIYVTGIPVKEQFKTPYNKYNSNYKKTKEILIMGGGLGLLPDVDKIIDTLGNIDNVNITIITGKNKKAYKKLKLQYPDVDVVGYTDKISIYMKKADIIITKAGGITLFESIYTCTPLFVIHPFLEQEINNASFIEENNIGIVIWDKKDDYTLRLIELIDDDNHIELMRNKMAIIKTEMIQTSVLSVVNCLNKGSIAS